MKQEHHSDRAAVRLVDVIMTFILLVALLAVAPILFTFTGMVASAADPFSRLLLSLVVPLLLIFLVFSVSRSAQRGA